MGNHVLLFGGFPSLVIQYYFCCQLLYYIILIMCLKLQTDKKKLLYSVGEQTTMAIRGLKNYHSLRDNPQILF